VHHIAATLGLESKSFGKGDDRHIVVKRRSKKKRHDGEELPQIRLHPDSEKALMEYLGRHPPK